MTSGRKPKAHSATTTRAGRPPLKNPRGGLTAAGRAYYRWKDGANLKPGVKGPADTPEKMKRKGSFLTRFFTTPRGPLKKPNGQPTRLALSAQAWGEPIPQTAADCRKLAAKGRRLLEQYRKAKEQAAKVAERKTRSARKARR